MQRSGRRLARRSSPRIKPQVALAAIAATTTACSSRAIATTYSAIATSSWSNAANWSPSGGPPGLTDDVSEPNVTGVTIAVDGTAGNGIDYVNSITLTETGTSALGFVGVSGGSTLFVTGAITKNGAGGDISFGSSTANAALTLMPSASSTNSYVPLIFGTGATGNAVNNIIAFHNSTSVGSVTFSDFGGLRAYSDYNSPSTISTTLAIQGPVSIAASTSANMQLRQDGTSTSSAAAIAMNGGWMGTLSNGQSLQIDVINTSASSASGTITLAGSAAGLTAGGTSSFIFGGGGNNGSSAQYKNAELILANGSALATAGVPIAVQMGGNTSSLIGGSATLSILSNGGYSFNNPIAVDGFTNPGSELYTIGGTNASGTTTFSGAITTIKNLQLEALNSGATTAFTGNIGMGTATGVGLTLVGAGTILLSGSNTYGGGTTVNSTATLLVNNTTGSGTGAGSVNVAGVLAGIGSISGAVNLTASSATIQPGTSTTIGTLHTGALTLFDNSTFAVNINSSSVTGTTGSSSELISSGAVTLGTSAFALLSVTDLGSTTLPGGDVFTIIQSANPITTTFQNLPEGTDVTYGANTFAISYMGDDVTLTTVTPEPGATAALAIGAMGMLGRRRRQSRGQRPG